jgi:hypothetical protein
MASGKEKAALQAEVERLGKEIAELTPRPSPKTSGRTPPSSDSARLVMLNRQLATAKLRLGQTKQKVRAAK